VAVIALNQAIDVAYRVVGNRRPAR